MRALAVLARVGGPGVGEAILKAYPAMPGRAEAAGAGSPVRPQGVGEGVPRARRGREGRRRRTCRSSRCGCSRCSATRTIDAAVRKHWGSVKPGTPEEKLAEVRRFTNDLRAGTGDAARGKAALRQALRRLPQAVRRGRHRRPGPDQHQPRRHRLAARQHRRSGRRRAGAVRPVRGPHHATASSAPGSSPSRTGRASPCRREGREDPHRPRPDRVAPRAADLADAREAARPAHPAGAPRPVPLPATAGEVSPCPRRHPPPVPDRRRRRRDRRGRRAVRRPAEAEGARRHHPRPGDVRRVPAAAA